MRWPAVPQHVKDSEWWWRPFRPRRTIWPTRDGWWCLFVVIGLGVAAINTGNNLLYLLVSLLLSLIVVSGMLSEQSLRGLRLEADVPDEIYAGTPALFGALLSNRKRWLTSYSITLEILVRGGTPRFVYLPRLEAGRDRLLTWEETLPVRGRQRLAGVRLTTRFPFGLFLKASRVMLELPVLVFPSVHPIPSAARATTRATSTGARAPSSSRCSCARWKPRPPRTRGSSFGERERGTPRSSKRRSPRRRRSPLTSRARGPGSSWWARDSLWLSGGDRATRDAF